MFAKILGTGSYLPKSIRYNSDIENMINASETWIFERTGIRKRHIASMQETVSLMGFYAAEKAISMAGINAKKIGMILVATTTSSHAFPSSACQIQKNLGIHDSISFDLSAACTGFIYALSIVNNYIKNELIEYALVIGSDVLSQTLYLKDKNTIVLFGDGAGAVVLGKSNQPGIISTHLHANGSDGELLTLPYYNRKSKKSLTYLTMSGNEVFKMAVNKLTNIIEETLSFNSLNINEIDWLIPHQSNIRIINLIAKKIGIDINKVIITVEKHGNTSSASVPLALDDAIKEKKIKKDNLVLLEAFGGGFTWGSVLLKI